MELSPSKCRQAGDRQRFHPELQAQHLKLFAYLIASDRLPQHHKPPPPFYIATMGLLGFETARVGRGLELSCAFVGEVGLEVCRS